MFVRRKWEREDIPKDWERGIIKPTLGKGDPTVCAKYRDITLLNVYNDSDKQKIGRSFRKMYRRILVWGFRRGRSTIGAIHTVSQLVE